MSWEQTKQRELQEAVSTKGAVESSEEAGVLVKDNWPVAMVGI